VLHALVDQGNTVVVIEHNLDVTKTADWIIDLGPEGGVKDGEVLVTGTPEDVVAEPRSYTGSYLKPLLSGGGRVWARRKRLWRRSSPRMGWRYSSANLGVVSIFRKLGRTTFLSSLNVTRVSAISAGNRSGLKYKHAVISRPNSIVAGLIYGTS
jgi:hypothetical protein